MPDVIQTECLNCRRMEEITSIRGIIETNTPYIKDRAISVLNDERPHLTVEVSGIPFRGLLDSGASCTVMSWEAVQKLPVCLTSTVMTLRTAN